LLHEKELCTGKIHCADEDAPGEHGMDCPITRLQEAMESPAGMLLNRALDLDFNLEKGFVTTLDETPADEYAVIKILKAEQSRYEREQMEKEKRNGR
jgi:hypothetical protein